MKLCGLQKGVLPNVVEKFGARKTQGPNTEEPCGKCSLDFEHLLLI